MTLLLSPPPSIVPIHTGALSKSISQPPSRGQERGHILKYKNILAKLPWGQSLKGSPEARQKGQVTREIIWLHPVSGGRRKGTRVLSLEKWRNKPTRMLKPKVGTDYRRSKKSWLPFPIPSLIRTSKLGGGAYRDSQTSPKDSLIFSQSRSSPHSCRSSM